MKNINIEKVVRDVEDCSGRSAAKTVRLMLSGKKDDVIETYGLIWIEPMLAQVAYYPGGGLPRPFHVTRGVAKKTKSRTGSMLEINLTPH